MTQCNKRRLHNNSRCNYTAQSINSISSVDDRVRFEEARPKKTDLKFWNNLSRKSRSPPQIKPKSRDLSSRSASVLFCHWKWNKKKKWTKANSSVEIKRFKRKIRVKSRAEIDDDDAATLQPLGDAAIWSFHSGAVPDTCIAFLSPKSFRRLFLFLKKKKKNRKIDRRSRF